MPNRQLAVAAVVRDADEDQVLYYKVSVDDQAPAAGVIQPMQSGIPQGDAANMTGRSNRSVTVGVNLDLLAPLGCHRINFYVSSRFRSVGTPAQQLLPETDGDLALATYWVVTTNAGEAPSLANCSLVEGIDG